MRIHIEANTFFTYPNISIICGKPETLNNDKGNILNPALKEYKSAEGALYIKTIDGKIGLADVYNSV